MTVDASKGHRLILMLDVLEHVAAPERLRRRAGDLLTPGGRILVTTPAFRWLWTRHDDLNHRSCAPGKR
jgi:2-polyprenyl-3-methyl-5-hydroxy-6-metoxy-1,4-benzoquinol methylase